MKSKKSSGCFQREAEKEIVQRFATSDEPICCSQAFKRVCDQIKAKQPYPLLHQGLIPFQSKLLFSLPLSLVKSPVIRSGL